jgi:hypothetical protein
MTLRLMPIFARVPVCRGQGVFARNRFGVLHSVKDFNEVTSKPIDPPVALVRFSGGIEVVELYELQPAAADRGLDPKFVDDEEEVVEGTDDGSECELNPGFTWDRDAELLGEEEEEEAAAEMAEETE